ncbi:hypothetical protein E1B28_013246 [Marasmius oreades]|uniref:DUF6699 domain-containing protein n=1 Tax=Marasmius oreades TaxID=181124 RepID=A0A9P7RPH5_9AGAR|nr:uncharacterized protein E1B28_013246 [Marasmius oreades]KAG7087267.1 hypothetical protein E1B28_013246 [Marasmius oreades]
MARRTVRFSTELTAISPPTAPDLPTKGDEIIPKIEDVHDILKFKSHPHLTFDVSKDPATVRLLSEALADGMRGEAATTPAVPYVKLVSKFLPWEIEIHSSSSPDGQHSFVSVADVLGGLYCALRIQVTNGEFSECDKQEDVTAAFKERCRLVGVEQGDEAAESQRRKGIRRVDFLRGNLKFCGLTAVAQSPRQLKFSVMK